MNPYGRRSEIAAQTVQVEQLQDEVLCIPSRSSMLLMIHGLLWYDSCSVSLLSDDAVLGRYDALDELSYSPSQGVSLHHSGPASPCHVV